MAELKISFIEGNSYRIEGAIEELLTNKRAKMMLRSQLAYREEGGALIVENEDGIEQVASILKLVAGYIGATIVYDDKTSSDIAEFKTREEDFARFSKEAKDIKENHCNPAEFKEFTDVLDEKMPCRHLYPLQLLSAYHLAFSQNGCNFSVPGAGKTSIVYGAYTYLKNTSDASKKVDKILIIGPLSSFGPWENEYEECFGVKVRSQRMSGKLSAAQKKQYFYGRTAELTLLSYQSVITLKDELEYFLRNNQVMVVLDEAHKVKSTNGGIIANKDALKTIYETGTGKIRVRGKVSIESEKGKRDMTKTVNDSRVPKLMDNISPYFIRIRKSDLELPPATEHDPIIVPMKDSQRRIYDFIEERFVEEANKETKESALHNILVRAKMIRLQQVATNPALLSEPLSSFSEEAGEDLASVEADDASIMKDIMRFYDEHVPAKYEECLRLVQKIIATGEKVIIWVIFIKNIERLEEYLKQNGINCKVLYGATPVASVKEFNSPESTFKVVIANPFAVAESISLHKACHNAIYLERSFNCAHFLQSKDRIHRYGLPKDTDTHYYYILSADSVDETIDYRLKEKERRMLDIIENTPIPLFLNTTDEGDADIKAILNDYVRRKARKVR